MNKNVYNEKNITKERDFMRNYSSFRKNMNNNRGITLIALVVTVIILIILARG